jgi:adenylate cyclase
VEAEGEDFPTMRAGTAFGPAVFRLGDWFGATVNRASRIADAAKPGTILVDAETRSRADARFLWNRERRRSLKGIDGRVALYRLSAGEQPARRLRLSLQR